MSDQWATRLPHPALRQLVRRYIGYTQHGVTLAVHRGLPSRSVTLVISLAEPVRVVAGPGAEHGPLHRHCVVGGLHLGPVLIEQDAYQQGLHLELNPLGVRALLGVPATELASTTVDAGELPVRWGRDLPARLRELPDWAARFDLLDRELAAAVAPVTLVSEIQWAWRSMVAGHGGVGVTELAEEIGWSRRHFSERFAREVGVPPKQAARLMRFERSGDLLRAGGWRSLADVAALAGYYDQAHMTNEWRSLAGCPPSRWIAEELPFLQAGGTDPLAD
ncbi:helix-turn-helix domain-containing protein [Amycolatopsis albispora]|uniref:AraC family transcriptional regulator n=1 Tax=Amycolatopsis albispora TaxID=1804986 RepID=A0A344L861_9PSEU|nr:helix-turn-helix domain-containing protein [Amycolatopsis albispora]AXB44235.1 AraC family transcriptional regulator [Amycolatopsis albispora]